MKHKTAGRFPLVGTTTTTVSSLRYFRQYHLFLFLLLASSSVSSTLANAGSGYSFDLSEIPWSTASCPTTPPPNKNNGEGGAGLSHLFNNNPGKEMKGKEELPHDPNKDNNVAISCKCPIDQETFNKLRDRAHTISKRLHESTKKALESADETAEMIHLLKLLQKSDSMLDKFHDKMHEKAQELKNIFQEMHQHLKGKK